VNGVRTVAAAVLVTVVTGACSDRPADRPAPAAAPSSSRPTSEVPELVPGGPGEANSTRDPGTEVGRPDAEHDDVAFMQMMVLHHRQALEMSALAPDRADEQQVEDVAARIAAAQAPEILVMAQWLTERSVDVPGPDEDPAAYDHAEHGHAGMVGMLGDDELAALADADGAAFDRLFLTGMVRHHEGAVDMALHVIEHGGDARVNQLATDIVAEQSAEIVRLERILATL
jgi:uncharacterized protein (DUF305 family)